MRTIRQVRRKGSGKGAGPWTSSGSGLRSHFRNRQWRAHGPTGPLGPIGFLKGLDLTALESMRKAAEQARNEPAEARGLLDFIE